MINLYQARIYCKRLINAIIGREFKEPYTHWELFEHIFDLVIEFIDWERSWYPVNTTKEEWEDKLQWVKQSILEYRNFTYVSWNSTKDFIEKLDKKWDKAAQEICSVFFNLWD